MTWKTYSQFLCFKGKIIVSSYEHTCMFYTSSSVQQVQSERKDLDIGIEGNMKMIVLCIFFLNHINVKERGQIITVLALF